MKMKKRGVEELFFTMFSLLVLGLVLIAGLGAVRSIRENTYIERLYIVNDLSALVSTLYAAPGDLILLYPRTVTKKYVVSFFQNNVGVKLPDEQIPTKAYYLADANLAPLAAELINPEFIQFAKKGNAIVAATDITNDPQLSCQTIDTANADWNAKPLVQLMHSPEAQELTQTLQGFSDSFKDPQQLSSSVDEQEFLLALTIDESPEARRIAKAYVNYDSASFTASAKLGCLILNKLSGQYTSLVVVPIHATQLSSTDSKKVLDSEKAAVYLVLHKKPDSAAAADAIYQAFSEYFT